MDGGRGGAVGDVAGFYRQSKLVAPGKCRGLLACVLNDQVGNGESLASVRPQAASLHADDADAVQHAIIRSDRQQ